MCLNLMRLGTTSLRVVVKTSVIQMYLAGKFAGKNPGGVSNERCAYIKDKKDQKSGRYARSYRFISDTGTITTTM